MGNLSDILRIWEPIIGLEVHAQLSTDTKMFCGCKNVYGDPPNSHTCPVCLGLPGSLPVVNEKAIEYALRLGAALGCEIARKSRFARKNYFYPDLPKGYQISQYEEPLCRGGEITIRRDGELKTIPLIRIHLEEDAGKSLHSEDGQGTRLDFNRCGVPLVEIVSEPVVRTPKEAKNFLTRLKQILRYLDICDCNMEEGNLRCDANISLRRRGEISFGVRTEMKNMNSFRSVERALAFEIERQSAVLEDGGEVDQATLLWNEAEQRAEVMRTKEEAHDYRYFPDPDLVPMVISEEKLASIRENVVELPHEKEDRFVASFGLRLEDAVTLTSDPYLADYFEQTVDLGADPDEAAKWILGEMLGVLKDRSLKVATFPIEPERLMELLKSLGDGQINVGTAKTIFKKMLVTDKHPAEIIDYERLGVVSDRYQLQSVVDEVLAEHSDEVLRYRSGKKALLGFFMGQVMRKTGGKSDPQLVRTLLKQLLDG